MATENIDVTVEQLAPASEIQVVLNNQVKYVAVDGPEASLLDLLNAILLKAEENAMVVETNADGDPVLPDTYFVVGADGQTRERTRNGNATVQAGERVIQDRRHHNG